MSIFRKCFLVLAVVFSATNNASAAPQNFSCTIDIRAAGLEYIPLREKPSEDAAEVARLETATPLAILSEEGDWLNVEVLGGKPAKGWLAAKYTVPAGDPSECRQSASAPAAAAPARPELELACVVNLEAIGESYLTLREKPSAGSAEIARLPSGTALSVLSRSGDWLGVETVGDKVYSGWVRGKYTISAGNVEDCQAYAAAAPQQPAAAAASYACVVNLEAIGESYLTLREGASAASGEIARLASGTALSVTGRSGNWLSVDVLGGIPQSGWVSARYTVAVADAAECQPQGARPDATADQPGDRPDGKAEDCGEEAVLDERGGVMLPGGATEVVGPELVDIDRGSLASLYPTLDTTTDAFYPNLPCEPSIGGSLPVEAEAEPTPDEVEAEEFLSKFDDNAAPEIVRSLTLAPIPPGDQVDGFPLGNCFVNRDVPVKCDSDVFLQDNQPFEGRDVIYVHGLSTEDFTAWLKDVPGARQAWAGASDPATAAAYLDPHGYFRKYANQYWEPHIRENLLDPNHPLSHVAGWQDYAPATPHYSPKANRYLVVAWSSNTSLEYGQRALMSQIYLAMTQGLNVVTPPSYPLGVVRPFCSNGCVIISHSTGPLLVSTAMGRAAAGDFGSGGKQIARAMFAQVSFEGAISGTRTATLALAVAMSTGYVPGLVCDAFKQLIIPGADCASFDLTFLSNSVLRDLVPLVAQEVWGPWIRQSPLRTVTVAGGHPTGKIAGLLKIFLPGLDDGVVSMNSACGNPNAVFPYVRAPSGITVSSLIKAFDFSENSGRLVRGIKMFLGQKNLIALQPALRYMAGACLPYVSTTGMVMPVASDMTGTPYDARARYPNYFSFLQAVTGHSYDGGSEGPDGNPWPSASGLPGSETVQRHYLHFATDNLEEELAVTDGAIYQRSADGTYLVRPNCVSTDEIVRGRRVSFKLFGHRHTWWIWKRTYHLAHGWELKQTSHYVYECVARR